ncbi:conserved hypothetical protein [Burkholderiales bacterium 8X]|nr:conserved hypothetical protein [Burkholderiales bacterium 8X]
MNARSENLELTGAAGRIAAVRDRPPAGTEEKGVAFIAHPHPLFGGTMDNKVVATIARAFVACGWTAVRFNFRGVGGSEGAHDEGRGETEDMIAVVEQLAPAGAIGIAGFSFGAFVASRVLESLWASRDVRHLVLVGTATSRFSVGSLPAEVHERTLVLHGELDETVPLASVMDWARPQSLPVTVIPGVEHFFHGQLPLLKRVVARHLSAGS